MNAMNDIMQSAGVSRHRLGAIIVLILTLAPTGESARAAIDTYNRYADFNAATNINDGDNSHGGVLSPNGSLWSYQYLTQNNRDAFGGISPAQFQPVNAYNDTLYRELELSGSTIANLSITDSSLSNYWNRDDLNPVLRNADLFAVFTAPRPGVYDLTGSMQWSQSTYATGYGAHVTIGTVQNGTYTGLLDEMVGDLLQSTDLNVQFDVPNYSDNTLLTGLMLEEGDQIVYGVRGKAAPHQHRTMMLYDTGVNIELVQLPEPGVLFFMAAGLSLIVGQRNPIGRSPAS